jgi:hypothetical protein
MKKIFDNQYLFGFGNIHVQTGVLNVREKENDNIVSKIPVIEISHFKEEVDREIGDCNDVNPEIKNITQLLFTNIESLEVLQRSIDRCREELLKNNKEE